MPSFPSAPNGKPFGMKWQLSDLSLECLAVLSDWQHIGQGGNPKGELLSPDGMLQADSATRGSLAH